MNKVSRALLSAIAATTLIWSCVEPAPGNDDETSSVKDDVKKSDGGTKDGGKRDAKDDDDDKDPAPDEENPDEENPDEENPDEENPDEENPDDGDTEDAGTDDDMMSKEDAGPAKPLESKIKGTAIEAECASNAKAEGGMCAGFFCGVTEEDIAAELDSTVCPFATAESVCSGDLSTETAKCARSVKENNLGLTDDELRPLVAECVMGQQPQYETELPMECLNCFLDAAQCASKNCLFPCLPGDNPACDQCRQDNNCNEPVMKCAELPSPF